MDGHLLQLGCTTVVASIVIACGGPPASGVDASTSSDVRATSDGNPKPSTFPRLVVAGGNGVRIWDNADHIVADQDATVTLGGIDGAALGVVVHDDILYVTSDSATSSVVRFANASRLAGGALPTGSIAASGFGGALPSFHTKLQVDRDGNLWIAASNALHLVAAAATATAPSARFTHPYRQIAGMVYDDDGDRLFGGQISGAGLLAWNAAAHRTGDVAAFDYKLAATVAAHAEIAAGRLYTAAYAPPNVAIWDGIGSNAAPKDPDIMLTNLCAGVGTSGELRYLGITHDVLVVIHNELLAGGVQVEKVCVFKGASAMTATRAPDAVAESASLHASGSNIDKAILTADGHLFVLGKDSVVIFKDALTAPTFVAKLVAGLSSSRDMIVLE